MSILARLGVKLALDSAEFKAGLDDATKNTKLFEANQKKAFKNAQQASSDLVGTLGRVAGGLAVVGAAVMAVAKKSDDISDMADAFDASIGSIVGMGKALEMSGGKADGLQNMLSKLSVNAQNAKEGSDQLRDSFKSVGVSASEVENLNPDELFARVAEQLAKIPGATERNAKAFELLGKAAKGVDWNKYVEEYKQVADPELAAAIKESADAWDNMQKGASSFYYFLVKIMQPLFAMINAMTTLADRYREFKQEGGTINFDPNNPMAEGITYAGEGKPQGGPEAPKREIPGGGYKQGSDRDKKRAEEIAKLKESFNLRVMEISKMEEAIKREGELIGLTQQEQELKKLAWEFEDNNAKVQADLQKQINEEKAKGMDMDKQKIALLQQEQETYKVLSEVALENAKIAEQANITKIRGQQILTDAEQTGFDTMVSNMEKMGQMNRAAFIAWKAMAVAQTIIDTYKGAQASYSALASIPYVGPALGIAAAIAAIGAGMARVNAIRATEYQGRAAGGKVIGGQPYIVGENGPELIVPHGSGGTVIPNNRLSSMMNNGGGVTYNGPYIANMSAIDTQSGIQFLAKNKSAIWAANLSASRSLPSTR